MKREKTTIYLNPKLKQKAKIYAVINKISLSDLINRILSEMTTELYPLEVSSNIRPDISRIKK
jgi:hypothetical protein